MPEPPPPPSRDASLASTTNYGPSRETSVVPDVAKAIDRSRSRQKVEQEREIELPYQQRGRSPGSKGSKTQRIVDQLIASEGVRQINKHTKQVGMLAKRPPPPRPASAAPPIKVRTFDEIAGATDDAPAQKQRTTSLGAAQPRRRLK